MHKPRWIEYEGRTWRLSELASEHHLAVGTLASRLDRFGCDESGIVRALCTGIASRSESGRRGKNASYWIKPFQKRQ